MENRKDVGKAFREKLSLIEKSPDAALWNRIENDLQQKQNKHRRTLILFTVFFCSVIGIILGGMFITKNNPLEEKDSILENNIFSEHGTSGQNEQNQNSVASETTDSRKTNNNPTTNNKTAENENTENKKEVIYNETQRVRAAATRETATSEATKTNEVTATTGVKNAKTNTAAKTANNKHTYAKLRTESYRKKKKYQSNSFSITSNQNIEKNTFSDTKHKGNANPVIAKDENQLKKKNKPVHLNFTNSGNENHIVVEKTKNKNGNSHKSNHQIPQTKSTGTATESQAFNSDNPIFTNAIRDSIASNCIAVCEEEPDSIQKPKKENKNLLKEQNEKEEDKKEEKPKIDIIASVFYAPTISGSLTGKSLINASFDDYKMGKPVTYSFGVYAGIKHKKLGIRVGFVKVDLENSLSINNSQGNPITDYSNIILSTGTTPSSINTYFATSDNVTIVQKASYTNIPIEFKYSVFNKNRFGIDAISGVSVILLDKNQLDMYGNNASKITLGKIDNQSKMNLGLNLGIGLHYNLIKNLQLDINPVLTYLHNVGNDYYKPYSLLLQSGFSYRF